MNRRLAALVLGSVVTLQGCSGFGVGESEYSCDGYEEGISCASAREVYRQGTSGYDPHQGHNHGETEAEGGDAEKGGAQTHRRASAQRRAGGIEPEADTENSQQRPQSRQVGQHVEITGPTPIRTQAKVMRVWVASYEDQSGDLHAPGLVYTEVQKRRWNIGNQASSGQNRTVSPLAQSQANGNHLEATSQPGPTQPESQQQKEQEGIPVPTQQ